MKSTQDPVGSMEDQAGAARFMREEIETCWTLIRGAAIGRASDRSAFAKLYMPCVRAYLAARWRSTSLASEIEDVVQEVFIACLREGGVLEGADPDHPSGFRALLIRVTRNMALVTERDRGRRAGHMKDGHTALESTPVDEPSLSQAFDRAYARAIMAQARDQMAQRAAELGDRAERRVELLRMRFDDGLPIRLIARSWGEDPAHLHREYEKARREFRAALADVVSATEHCTSETVEQECRRLIGFLST